MKILSYKWAIFSCDYVVFIYIIQYSASGVVVIFYITIFRDDFTFNGFLTLTINIVPFFDVIGM